MINKKEDQAGLHQRNIDVYKKHSVFSHGSAVALYSNSQNRFIRIREDGKVDGRGGRKNVDQVNAVSHSELLLVIHVSEHVFAFYGVHSGQYICMKKERKVSSRSKRI